MTARTRAELIGDLLDLAAMLAADEAIPFDRQTPAFSHHVVADTDEAGIHRIDEIAAVLGVEPTRSAGGRHHEAIKMVGGIEYKAVYIEKQGYKVTRRIGELLHHLWIEPVPRDGYRDDWSPQRNYFQPTDNEFGRAAIERGQR